MNDVSKTRIRIHIAADHSFCFNDDHDLLNTILLSGEWDSFFRHHPLVCSDSELVSIDH